MSFTSRAYAFVFGLATLLYTGVALGQALTADSILRETEDETDRIQELLGLLDHPDPHIRSLALGRMVEDGTDYERHMALQRAFTSSDANLRHAAIKYRLQEVGQLTLELQIPREHRGDVTENVLERFGSDLTIITPLAVDNVDFRTGRFNVSRNAESLVNGDELTILYSPRGLTNQLGHCIAEVTLQADASATGVSRCGSLRIPLNTRLRLF